eukprot:1395024-Prymnesium_polylepis.1
MKLDVEAHEYTLLPWLLASGSLCSLRYMSIEWHLKYARRLIVYERTSNASLLIALFFQSPAHLGARRENKALHSDPTASCKNCFFLPARIFVYRIHTNGVQYTRLVRTSARDVHMLQPSCFERAQPTRTRSPPLWSRPAAQPARPPRARLRLATGGGAACRVCAQQLCGAGCRPP